ncbi:hypothetical protein [Moraxella lacunata]|nr:hypothetical protein [Moraxella lacunata]
MIVDNELKLYVHSGYIAGADDGIVTVGGVPASRAIYLYEVSEGMSLMKLLARQASLKNGRYLFNNLDPHKKYLIMARDLPPTDGVERYEPAVWDYVTPMSDKTIDEQMELWQSWQT